MKTVLLLVGLISAAAAVSCLDEGGNPVDWWVMIKMPKLKTSKDPAAGSGFGYAYMDGSTGGWVIPGKRLDENVNGALGATIQQRSSSIAFGAYNDDPPDGHASSSYGHAKGVFGFDKSGGFWLLHSVPRFPRESSEAYTFPDYAKIYGQSFICGTFDAATFNDIGTQLQYYRGAFYESNLPADLESLAPNIYAAANGEFIKDAGSNIKTIKTKGGFAMDHMAKNAKYADDFWETMPEPHYDSSMHIETWIRSPVEPSYCKPEWAYNSQSVRFMGFPGTDIDWKYTQDHSKWGITVDGPTVTCIGGINRMLSQKKRGGGAMCINHAGVHAAFQSLIVDVDPCPALDEPKAVLALPQTTFAAPTSAPALTKLSAPVAALTKLSAPVAALNKFSAPAPALTTFAAPSKDNDACDVCEAAIDQIKEEIGKPEVRAALIGSLKEACEHLPSGSETCKTAVEEFVGKALDAAAGIDSHRVCKALQACDGSFELGDLSQAFVQLLVADAVNEEGFKAGAGPQCAACKAAVKKIKELLTSDAVVEKIVGVLDEACGKLPDEEKAEKCVAAVEKFVPKLVGLIGKIPGTLICKAAHLC